MVATETPDFGLLHVDPSWKIAVVRSVWYPELTEALVKGAMDELVAHGIPRGHILTVDAGGSYELPLLCKAALEAGAEGAIAFGVIVQGATHHAKLVADQSAAGCMRVQLDSGKPVVFEVLFTDSIDDARIRCIGPKGKGPLAAKTLLTQLAKLAELR